MYYPFWIIFIVLAGIIIICDRKYYMLRDTSKTKPYPYSWARVQLGWWTVIVLSSFTSILFEKGQAPTLDPSTVILLGISAATIATARMIDITDEQNPLVVRHQDHGGVNFFLDIISDQSGPSISRFQTLIFNVVFGVWFIGHVLAYLVICNKPDCINTIMPVIQPTNLVLLGLSSATYAAMKTTENKTIKPTDQLPDEVPDESVNSSIAQG
jgi:hypothetical protein